MPPKPRITKEMVVEAAFAIARTEGADRVNARTVSARLGCSTQPVMYHFRTIESLKTAVYKRADAFHSAYIADVDSHDPLQGIGRNYIRFAVRERHLFRFLFQSDRFSGSNLLDLVNAQEIQPVIGLLCQQTGLRPDQAQTVFRTVFLWVHGYASLFANNEIVYDEESIASDLDTVYAGAVCALQASIDGEEGGHS